MQTGGAEVRAGAGADGWMAEMLLEPRRNESLLRERNRRHLRSDFHLGKGGWMRAHSDQSTNQQRLESQE
jgi:hypothetical protein